MQGVAIETPAKSWVNDLIEQYRKDHPKKATLIDSNKIPFDNKNIEVKVPEDVFIVVTVVERIPDPASKLKKPPTVTEERHREVLELKAGWQVMIYREWGICPKGMSIATIYAPGEQITLKYNALPKRFRE